MYVLVLSISKKLFNSAITNNATNSMSKRTLYIAN